MSNFVNPYVFFPISKDAPDRDKKTNGKLSGKIDCSIEIKSPTFIPNTTLDYKVNDHAHKVFFSYQDLSGVKTLDEKVRKPDNPVIPGSEIRGMIRNLYEQLTNSCFSQVDEFNIPYKRTNDPKVLCMMVHYENDGWYIYPLREEESNSRKEEKGDPRKNKNYYGGDGKFFCEKRNGADTGFKPGYEYKYCPPENINSIRNRTQYHFIYYSAAKLKKEDGFKLSDDAVKRLGYVIGADENVKGGYEKLGCIFSKGSNKPVTILNQFNSNMPLIVYADKESIKNNFKNDNIYLSTSAITKEFFSNTIAEILEKNSKHQPCSDPQKLCPACRLFGMIGKDGATKGSLRFTDTEFPEKIEFSDNEITLPILGQPRISSTEFYLREPQGKNAKMWNYDYYVKEDESRVPYDPVLAGRKVYWNGNFKPGTPTNMNSTVTPLEKGEFKFSVFFDRITKEELENLVFCLKLRDSDEKGTVHKIGTGKPVGMGQVKIRVEKVETVSYKMENGKISRKDNDYQFEETSDITTREAKLICKYSSDQSFKNSIDYPHCVDGNGENVTEIFKWFAKNRGVLNDPTIKRRLRPLSIDDVDYSLPKYVYEKSDKKYGKSGNGYRGPNDRHNNWNNNRNGNYNNNRNKNWNNNYKKGKQQ